MPIMVMHLIGRSRNWPLHTAISVNVRYKGRLGGHTEVTRKMLSAKTVRKTPNGFGLSSKASDKKLHAFQHC